MQGSKKEQPEKTAYKKGFLGEQLSAKYVPGVSCTAQPPPSSRCLAASIVLQLFNQHGSGRESDLLLMHTSTPLAMHNRDSICKACTFTPWSFVGITANSTASQLLLTPLWHLCRLGGSWMGAPPQTPLQLCPLHQNQPQGQKGNPLYSLAGRYGTCLIVYASV